MTTSQPSDSPVVLVTGAARRIGAEIVRHFHARGYRVLIHCRHSLNEARALAEACNHSRSGSAAVLQQDLSSAEDAKKLAAQALNTWQRLDVLINNASAFFPTPVGQITQVHWDALMDSNAKVPLFLSQALAPALQASQGCIINITDIHAEAGLSAHTPYTMAKAALLAMTRSLARELAPDIRVNAIAPGAILWPESAEDISSESQQAILHGIPMATLGHPSHIAATACFLATQATYVTGEIIRVDGGRRLTG
ncbi:pteridine reductase [Pseudohongiella nitratireducens]|uniref:Pteridine reductase n=1 Tax=Pseudohongiella nitratireducens TaxID=1768907 RepID=A0A916QLM9_9GAMM|nr:pteridine reductase [Pseudohongiella nitratireducens]MDF1622247.1 pteridine reductase [Pseudohongiella nitratireducens]GFZ76095.1 pteridine reductase [Pseudohongiella nitratireducens]|tara:strand:- start:871 stop:1629 length:759 start_codon:yes stop_codon:yes gene_type:complete